MTGYSSFRLVIIIGLLYLLLLSIATLFSILYGELSTTLGLLLGFVVNALLTPQFFRHMLNREKDLTERAMNPMALFWPYGILRLAYMVLVLITLASSWRTIHMAVIDWSTVISGPCSFLWGCLMYIAACTPKPPSVLKAGNTLAAQSL